MYGHPIELNYNEEGNNHKTLIGGVVSIIIQAALLSYVVIVFYRMFTFAEDKNSSTQNLVHFIRDDDPLHQEGIDKVPKADLNQLFFVTVRKEGYTVEELNNLERYMTLTVSQIDTDWNKPLDAGRFQTKIS